MGVVIRLGVIGDNLLLTDCKLKGLNIKVTCVTLILPVIPRS